jgi:hypothetical protein
MHLIITKGVYDKTTANMILSGRTLKQFPINSKTGQECPLFSLLLSIVLKFLPRAIR